VGRRPRQPRTISEEELDAQFAAAVQRHWQDYSAEISNDIARAQAEGLANILHMVLSGEEPRPDEEDATNADEAYHRVSEFLSRQPGFEEVLDPPAEFANKYRSKPQIRSIVKHIDRIERTIEEVSAPRSRLKDLLESMYSGGKRIVLGEKEVSVEISPEGKINLPSLSSGEKQLFFISLAALRSANHSLIIDEPELSMHVDWQKKLVSSLLQLNSNMQLIMATHSPEIMADIPDSKVFSL
jgi:predicted ATP-binding protein involved in virulence